MAGACGVGGGTKYAGGVGFSSITVGPDPGGIRRRNTSASVR